MKEYNDKHRERQRPKRQLNLVHYRSRKYRNGGKFDLEEWKAMCDFYGNICLRCGRSDLKLTMDHVIPVSRGGRCGIMNMQPLCQPCNRSKGINATDYRTHFAEMLLPAGEIR